MTLLLSVNYPGLSPIGHAWFKYHLTASLGENSPSVDEDFISSNKSEYNSFYLLLITLSVAIVFIFPFNVVHLK